MPVAANFRALKKKAVQLGHYTIDSKGRKRGKWLKVPKSDPLWAENTRLRKKLTHELFQNAWKGNFKYNLRKARKSMGEAGDMSSEPGIHLGLVRTV